MWHPNVNSVPHQYYWGNTRSNHVRPPACLFGTTSAFELNLDSFLWVKTGKFQLIDRCIPLVGIVQAVHTSRCFWSMHPVLWISIWRGIMKIIQVDIHVFWMKGSWSISLFFIILRPKPYDIKKLYFYIVLSFVSFFNRNRIHMC